MCVFRRDSGERETRKTICITMLSRGTKLDFVFICHEYPSPPLQSGSSKQRNAFLWAKNSSERCMVGDDGEQSTIEICMKTFNSEDERQGFFFDLRIVLLTTRDRA